MQNRKLARIVHTSDNLRQSFTLLKNWRKSKFAKFVQTCPGPSLTFPDLQRTPETRRNHQKPARPDPQKIKIFGGKHGVLNPSLGCTLKKIINGGGRRHAPADPSGTPLGTLKVTRNAHRKHPRHAVQHPAAGGCWQACLGVSCGRCEPVSGCLVTLSALGFQGGSPKCPKQNARGHIIVCKSNKNSVTG